MSGPCLGDRLTALVDGELGHAARERALAHLAGCDTCRAEVDEQRRLKARLAGLGGDAPSADLSSRLLALSVPGVDPSPSVPTASPVGVGFHGATRPYGAARPPARPGARRLRRTATVAGSVLAGGLAAALVLGGPPAGGTTTPIDPGADVFVVEHASTTGGLPLREPAGAAVPSR